ncbi:MAG TPA: hypothetical protein VMT26_00455 [Candidatus Bathyarchaeia archaeon]|nr:hypothetical protein [Candidatus Bathyarchaeia archaeon]
MSNHQRTQDILIGVIFGIVLGLVVNLWSSVYDHLFFENTPRESLVMLFIIYSIGIVAIGVYLWRYIEKLGNQPKSNSLTETIYQP